MSNVVWVIPLFMTIAFVVGFVLALYSHVVFKSGIQKFFSDEMNKAEEELRAKTKELRDTADRVYLELYTKLSEISQEPKPADYVSNWDKDTLN